MRDEDIWLLTYGSRWVDWWEAGNEDETDVIDLWTRMHDARKLEVDKNGLRVRLKKEKNESV